MQQRQRQRQQKVAEEEEKNIPLGSNSSRAPQGRRRHQPWVCRQNNGHTDIKLAVPVMMANHHGRRTRSCWWIQQLQHKQHTSRGFMQGLQVTWQLVAAAATRLEPQAECTLMTVMICHESRLQLMSSSSSNIIRLRRSISVASTNRPSLPGCRGSDQNLSCFVWLTTS